MSCSTALHMATAAMHAAKLEGRTAVAVFADLKSAFYSCIRTTALPLQGDAADEDAEYIQKTATVPAGLLPCCPLCWHSRPRSPT